MSSARVITSEKRKQAPIAVDDSDDEKGKKNKKAVTFEDASKRPRVPLQAVHDAEPEDDEAENQDEEEIEEDGFPQFVEESFKTLGTAMAQLTDRVGVLQSSVYALVQVTKEINQRIPPIANKPSPTTPTAK